MGAAFVEAASSIEARWSRLSLAERFAWAGGVVMIMGMLVTGAWVSARIEDGVLRNSAAATALFMESVIAPSTQELATADRLSPGAAGALEAVFARTPLGERVVSYKFWSRDGEVLHARDPALIGKRFAVDHDLLRAWDGEVVAHFGELHGAENAGERSLGLPLLEIYSPVRQGWSGEVIAVAEFYEVAIALERDLSEARTTSWLVVGLVTLVTAAALFGVVRSGGRTIARQQVALQERVSELAALATQNRALGDRVRRASSRVAELNERALRRVSADLHDGPAQLLALAALKLDALRVEPDTPTRARMVDVIRDALDEALRDIRGVSRGLALPEIENLRPSELVARAVAAHRDRTGADVAFEFEGVDAAELEHAHRICVFRFLQEALSNAYRHGGNAGVRVEARVAGRSLIVTVEDRGPGFTPSTERTAAGDAGGGLGLVGLRERAESLGGAFAIESAPGCGALVRLSVPLGDGR